MIFVDSRHFCLCGLLSPQKITKISLVTVGLPCRSAGKESACKRETWVRSLAWEDPLEKGKATHSSILA